MYSFVDVKIGDDFVEIPKGGRLLGVDVDHPGIIPFRCKQGICGTCRIEVVYGQENVSPPNPAESKFLDRLGHNGGSVRLACQLSINGPVEVRLCDFYNSRKTKF